MAYYGIPTKAIHEQWLGLVQPVGLVVAPAVLTKLELVPEQRTARLSALQLELTGLLDEAEGVNDQPVKVVSSFRQLATELLDWGDSDLVEASALETVPEVVLSEYGETLRPTHGVLKLEGEGLQALVLDLSQWRDASGTLTPQWDRDLDAAWNPTGNGWDATPQQRFERLLKETEHPIGLLFNGTQLRLVHAPRGESSGHITMPLEPMAEVAGRPMLGALELLLGVDRLFGGNPEQRLPALLAASRKNQNEVSTRLAEQVLEALWELLLGFDAAERIAQDNGRSVLGALPTTEEGQKQLYGGLITVLLRLVFLLYAEDEELMPRDSLYGQNYSVSSLADRLRQERFEHQSAMADRRGAWASLLSLFRLVYDGGGADPSYLPARHGELFDPDAFPFLEGRDTDSFYDEGILTNLPAVSDDVMEKVLSKLIWLDGERLSYRSLDVEQIGSVYEGIMGFTVEGATGPSVGITYRPPRQKITITVVVDAEQLLAQSGSKREKWLDEQAGVALKLPAKVKSELKSATTLAELCVALDKKLSPHTPNGLAASSLILQPTAERRRSGSHYTPRALTEPIVAEAFRPWLERCNGQPTAEQILALKVCDPAMGSGAFLVAVCRYLAVWLVQAWERDGYPEGFRQEWDKDTVARRLIAQRCLYGVDKNPFAVNLAKLSLWLVTLSEHLPFTFVDHALKCGDSLVGYGVQEIQSAMKEVQLGFLNEQNQVFAQMGMARRESFGDDSLNDEGYDRKKVLLQQQIKASEGLRQAGDLMVAAFFDAAKAKERADKQQVYLAMLSGAFNDEGLQDSIQEIRDRLAAGDKGITPFHWDLEFPEVFSDERGGFDSFVGNPPFVSSTNLHTSIGPICREYIDSRKTGIKGRAVDLCAHFFRHTYDMVRPLGTLCLLATNTICQGDTREASLRFICTNKGAIYYARKRVKWEGSAAVVASLACILKTTSDSERLEKSAYNSYLIEIPFEQEPAALLANKELCYIGHQVYGAGFTFDDRGKSGLESPIALAEQLLEDEAYTAVVRPYQGAKDFVSSPKKEPTRYVLYFGSMDLADIKEKFPRAYEIALTNILPERSAIQGDYSVAQRRRDLWWRYGTLAGSMQEKLEASESCIAIPIHSMFHIVDIGNINWIYAHSMVVIPAGSDSLMCLIQSRTHEYWTTFRGSSLGEATRYTPTDCFESFPLPMELLNSGAITCSATLALTSTLGKHGHEYRSFRDSLMVSMDEGLTATYNRLHDPEETSPGLLELRRLHDEMDQAVLAAYGWSDVPTACGFGLDYLDTEEDAQLPDALQERIDDGNLFFWDANDALDFQGQLQAYGAITGRRKLPWRYRWPDAVRDDVLARLLALNAERYAEEVALGLHSKGGKQTAKASKAGGTAGAKRRGRPPKAVQSGETEPMQDQQIRLGL